MAIPQYRIASKIPEQFSGCSFVPITQTDLPTSIILSSDNDNSFSTTSYFLDSSGRTRFRILLELDCRCKERLESLLAAHVVSPAPTNYTFPEHDVDDVLEPPTCALRIEVKSLTTYGTKIVTVEQISILSTTIHGEASLHMDTEIVVRAATPVPMNGPLPKNWSTRDLYIKTNYNSMSQEKENDTLSTRLEICATLVTKVTPSATISSTHPPLGLLALESGSLSFPTSHHVRLTPIQLNLNMTSALCVSVRNVSGSSGGSTLVSLTIRHSNTHSEPVTITNIALHPGHSRADLPYSKTDHSMPGGETSVTDMSRFVKWGYAPRTEPQLPLVLHPNNAYSTVLTIDAGQDLRSRSFVSPISVTAAVGSSSNTVVVVVATEAQWTTGRVAVEPADAFRVDMNVAQQFNYVGAPLVVSLRVMNLSTKTRDLMLLMAKDDDKNTMTSPQRQSGTVTAAVVSQVNGYTFGVWGLSEDDDGTKRQNRDHDLLAVDAALLLGEVKGQHSVDAELRFVPLREGTLDVPNLKLYDKTEGKWYNCVHKLQIVATAQKSMA